MKINEFKLKEAREVTARFSPKFPEIQEEEKLDEGPCDIAEKSDIEKMTGEQYVKYANWKKECEEAERANPSTDDEAELDKMFDGKSPHKKGTEKHKKHMAAIHAGESTRVDELGRIEFIFDKGEWSEEELESLASMDGAEWDVEAGTITASGHRPGTLKVLNQLADVMPGVERGKTEELPKDQGRNVGHGESIDPVGPTVSQMSDADLADYISSTEDEVKKNREQAEEIANEVTSDHAMEDSEDSPDNEDWDNDVTKTLRKIVDEHQAQKVKFDNGKKTTVDAFTASAVIQGLEAMRPDLQVRAADFINKSPGHLVKFSEMVFGSQKEGYGESVDPVGLSLNVMREAFADYEKDSSERWDKYANYRGLRQKMAHIAKRLEVKESKSSGDAWYAEQRAKDAYEEETGKSWKDLSYGYKEDWRKKFPVKEEVKEGKMKELSADLDDKEMSDEDFKKKYSTGRAEMRKSLAGQTPV